MNIDDLVDSIRWPELPNILLEIKEKNPSILIDFYNNRRNFKNLKKYLIKQNLYDNDLLKWKSITHQTTLVNIINKIQKEIDLDLIKNQILNELRKRNELKSNLYALESMNNIDDLIRYYFKINVSK